MIFNQQNFPKSSLIRNKCLLFSWRLRAGENVNSGGGYQRHLNDQRSRETVTERGANIAVWNARESASVVLTQHNTLDPPARQTSTKVLQQKGVTWMLSCRVISLLSYITRRTCLTSNIMLQFICTEMQRRTGWGLPYPFDFPQSCYLFYSLIHT